MTHEEALKVAASAASESKPMSDWPTLIELNEQARAVVHAYLNEFGIGSVESLREDRDRFEVLYEAQKGHALEHLRHRQEAERQLAEAREALKAAETALFWAARKHHEHGNIRAQKATELSAHAVRAALSSKESSNADH